MDARIVRLRALTSADEVAWRDLASRAVEPNPLFEPECLVPAADHQDYGDELEVAFAEEGGRFFAAVPLRAVTSWRSFPYPFVTTKVRRMSYCGTPLVDAERGVEAVAAVVAELRAHKTALRGRVLALNEVHQDGPVDDIIQRAVATLGLPLQRYESWERGILRRRDGGNYLGLQNTKFKKGVRRCARRLQESLGEEPVLVDRSDDPAAIDRYIEMEASGYKRATGVAMSTVDGEPAYFRGMCRRFAQEGRLFVYALECAGRTLAMGIFVRAGVGWFALKMSYDERFARFSPGVQVHLGAMERFHDTTDAQWIDTCSTPEHAILMKLYVDRKRYTSFFVVLGHNPVDRLAVWMFMTVRPLHRRVVEWLRARRRRPARPDAWEPDGASGPEVTDRDDDTVAVSA